jgi:hypothetical protein
MRFVDDGFSLLSGRTGHALPKHRDRGDPLETWVRRELRSQARARQPPRPMPLRAAGQVFGALAGVFRRDTGLGA